LNTYHRYSGRNHAWCSAFLLTHYFVHKQEMIQFFFLQIMDPLIMLLYLLGKVHELELELVAGLAPLLWVYVLGHERGIQL
jgi:hypothetical protein